MAVGGMIKPARISHNDLFVQLSVLMCP